MLFIFFSRLQAVSFALFSDFFSAVLRAKERLIVVYFCFKMTDFPALTAFSLFPTTKLNVKLINIFIRNCMNARAIKDLPSMNDI